MIGYYYKSESDVVFRRHSLEYEKTKNASRNSNTQDLNTVSSMCNANDPFQKATTYTTIVMNPSHSDYQTI
jgi:hypothetical protein